MDDYPERGELVIATVERVLGYGAFVRLDEYGHKQGIVSIREFSQKWVKNPRDYLKEGQKTVLKVLRVNKERQHIDLSLKAVNEHERKTKIKEYKLQIRAQKLIERLASKFQVPVSEIYKTIADPIITDYGSLYEAFVAVANGQETLTKYVSDPALREAFLEEIKSTIKPSRVSLSGYVSLHSNAPDGVDQIRNSLMAGEEEIRATGETSSVAGGEITYISPPLYKINITAENYKKAEQQLKKCYEAIKKTASSYGIDAEFSKDKKHLAS